MKQVFDHIETSHIDGKPRHVADPATSAFDIISYVEFQALPQDQVLDRLRIKNILVTGCPHPNLKFNEAGLRTLCPLESEVAIQGIKPTSGCDWHSAVFSFIDYSISSEGPVTKKGVSRDILANAIPEGKILNGLDFPMWKDAEWERSFYATDMLAWDHLRGRLHCAGPTTPYPTEHMRWGLAATAHTFTSLHIDSDGFATFIQIMCGKKVWVVFRPSPDLPLWNTNVFTNGDFFQHDKIPENAQFGLEAIVLRPGDQLYVFSSVFLMSLSL